MTGVVAFKVGNARIQTVWDCGGYPLYVNTMYKRFWTTKSRTGSTPVNSSQRKEKKMEKLIEALQIFLKYGDPEYPTHCEHDTLYVDIDPEKVSEKDIKKLDKLGFFVDEEDPDGFTSFRYGSC